MEGPYINKSLHSIAVTRDLTSKRGRKRTDSKNFVFLAPCVHHGMHTLTNKHVIIIMIIISKGILFLYH